MTYDTTSENLIYMDAPDSHQVNCLLPVTERLRPLLPISEKVFEDLDRKKALVIVPGESLEQLISQAIDLQLMFPGISLYELCIVILASKYLKKTQKLLILDRAWREVCEYFGIEYYVYSEGNHEA